MLIFTVFGGGKGAHWVVFATDQDGWRYEVDERSIFEIEPGLLRFRVRSEKDGRSLNDVWVLDTTKKLLTLESQGKAEAVGPGSVAFTALVYLKRTGRVSSGLKVLR